MNQIASVTDISDAEATNLFMYPDRLPRNTKNFLRLQKEIAGLAEDTGEIPAVVMPASLESKYAIKGSRLKELPSEIERRDMIRRFLAEVEEFFRRFYASMAKLEATEHYLQKTAADIRAQMRGLSAAEISAAGLAATEKELENISGEIAQHRNTLEDRHLPSTSKLDNVDKSLDNLSTRTYSARRTFNEKFRTYTTQNAARPNAADSASHASEPDDDWRDWDDDEGTTDEDSKPSPDDPQ